MSLIQKYLVAGGTIAELQEQYAIDATRHKTYPNLVLFKYNQIESPKAHPLVVEARGIILDQNNNWNVVCKRFNRFFNHGEQCCAPINFTTAKVTKKVDGSLITLYYYDNKWNACTSGSPDASGQVGDWPFTFAELFWKVFNNFGLKVPDNTNLCPSFELTSPWNVVVVTHEEERLTFIGLHDRTSCKELSLDVMPQYPSVQSYSFESIDEIVALTKTFDGFKDEGFVIADLTNKTYGDFSRQKIKSDDYVAKHHLKSSWSVRRAVEVVIFKNETEEVKAYFPMYAVQLDDIKNKYDKFVHAVEIDYERLKHIEPQKAFAIEAVKTICSSALFMLRAGKTNNVKEYINSLHVDRIIRLLGLKDDVVIDRVMVPGIE